MMLSFVDETISKVLPSITRATVPTISAAIAVIGISIARQQTRTVALMRLRFKVGSNPTFLRRGNGAGGSRGHRSKQHLYSIISSARMQVEAMFVLRWPGQSDSPLPVALVEGR